MPKAFERAAGLDINVAHERLRSALAEGEIVAVLRMLSGQRYEIPQRMWDKDSVARKVYPRFHDGWMRMGLNELSGPYVEGWIFIPTGWIFIPTGSVEHALKHDQKKPGRKRQFSRSKARRWYQNYVSRHLQSGARPSREDDQRAARDEFGDGLPRETMRDLRRELAPEDWKRAGPRKSGRK